MLMGRIALLCLLCSIPSASFADLNTPIYNVSESSFAPTTAQKRGTYWEDDDCDECQDQKAKETGTSGNGNNNSNWMEDDCDECKNAENNEGRNTWNMGHGAGEYFSPQFWQQYSQQMTEAAQSGQSDSKATVMQNSANNLKERAQAMDTQADQMEAKGDAKIAKEMRDEANGMRKEADDLEQKATEAGTGSEPTSSNQASWGDHWGGDWMGDWSWAQQMQMPGWPFTNRSLNKTTESNSQLKIGLGVGFGVLLVIIMVSVIFYLLWRRRKRASVLRTKQIRLHPTAQKNYQNDYQRQSEVRMKQPTNAACPTMAAQYPMVAVVKNLMKMNSRGSSSISVDDKWLIDSSSVFVDYDNKLGSGAFCSVFKGKIIGEAPICKVNPTAAASRKFCDCECAVKILPEFADDISRSDFSQEINFMKTLQYHAHLVSMLGWTCDGISPKLLVEYCKHGDLLHFLRSRKEEIIHAYENSDILKIRNLVSFGWQISNGLEYLTSLGCIHRDIAARNVLVDESYVAKIGDFGLCRLSDALLYTGRGGRLPLKWMAPESLESFEYTHKSDVWSYGVLLYEVFSFGEVPYALLDSVELLAFFKAGKRLPRPLHCPLEIYSVMQTCWELDPLRRPSFSEICTNLSAVLENAAENYGYVTAVETNRRQSVLNGEGIDVS